MTDTGMTDTGMTDTPGTTPAVTEAWPRSTEPLVLHVIPSPAARGAQREARALADLLDHPGVRCHRVLTLFDGPREVDPNFSLRCTTPGTPGVGFQALVAGRLGSALGRLDPAVVVAHGGEPLKYLVTAMIGRRRPLAYYAIGTYAGSRHEGLQLAMWRRLLSRADRVAAEGYEVADECTTLLRVPADRVVMTPNGRDPQAFHPGHRPANRHPPTVTFVGALTDGKRPDRFIELVAVLRRQGVEIHGQVVGDGPLRPSLVVPAERSGVELLGSRPDVAALLADTDLLVFASRPTGEGMPGVLIEAGLSGVPVVATDVEGVRTIVDDGVTGVVVPADDFGALVDATARLLADRSILVAMGSAARRRCAERFSLDAVGAAWRTVLDPLMPSPAG